MPAWTEIITGLGAKELILLILLIATPIAVHEGKGIGQLLSGGRNDDAPSQ